MDWCVDINPLNHSNPLVLHHKFIFVILFGDVKDITLYLHIKNKTK